MFTTFPFLTFPTTGTMKKSFIQLLFLLELRDISRLYIFHLHENFLLQSKLSLSISRPSAIKIPWVFSSAQHVAFAQHLQRPSLHSLLQNDDGASKTDTQKLQTKFPHKTSEFTIQSGDNVRQKLTFNILAESSQWEGKVRHAKNVTTTITSTSDEEFGWAWKKCLSNFVWIEFLYITQQECWEKGWWYVLRARI